MTLTAPPWDLIAEWIPHIVWITDSEGSCQYFNQRGLALVGLKAGDVSGTKWLRVVHPEDVPRARAAWQTALSDGTPFEVEYRVRTVAGDYRWMVARALPVRGPNGEVVRWAGTWTDIDDLKSFQDKLGGELSGVGASLAVLDALEATAPIGISVVDRDFRVIHMNELLAGLNGTSSAEAEGRSLAEILGPLWPHFEPNFTQVLESGKPLSRIETARSAVHGFSTHWLTSYFPVIGDDDGVQGVGVVMTDVSDQTRQDELHTVVMENMAEGMYALDADGLVTYVNAAASRMLGWTSVELLGHPMHEIVHFQKEDGTPLPFEECPLLKVGVTGRSVRVTSDAFTRKDGTIFPTAYSAAPLFNDTIIEGVVVVFRDITDERAESSRAQRDLASLAWLGRITDALAEDRMVLYSQPIFAATGAAVSEELLLRMKSRTGEIIMPRAFLPVAEKYGLINEIDRWVVVQAIRLAATGRKVEANLSAATVGSLDILPLIESELRSNSANPANVIFEITETALMGDIDAGARFTEAIAALGCGISLDDFGTGFGSFTYLKRLSIQHLKIDIEFVRDLLTNEANQHLVRAIVSMAKAFKLQTVAEGVEDEATWQFLRRESVDFGQGFHLGRPAPID